MTVQEVIPGGRSLALSDAKERFELQQRQARTFSASALVPDHLRKGPPEVALANCYIALTMAEAMGEIPIIVMQNIHIVNGKAGFSSQYMIARANSSGVFRGRIDWRIDRDDPGNLKVTAFATLADTGQEVAVTVDMAMAKAEQWTKNPKYQSMPEIMLRYRSAAFLVRFYAPDVMLGYQTAEEVEDVVISGGPDLTATPLTAEMLVEQSQPQAEQVDTETGEIVDVEAEPVASEPEPPQTDYAGAKPANAKHGESWFNPDDGKVRYARQTPNGMKWYLNPPEEAEPQPEPEPQTEPEQSQDEAAQQTLDQIDGPLEQGDPGPQPESSQQDNAPAWKSTVDYFLNSIPLANRASLQVLDKEFQKHMAALPEDVVQEVETALRNRRKALADAG